MREIAPARAQSRSRRAPIGGAQHLHVRIEQTSSMYAATTCAAKWKDPAAAVEQTAVGAPAHDLGGVISQPTRRPGASSLLNEPSRMT